MRPFLSDGVGQPALFAFGTWEIDPTVLHKTAEVVHDVPPAPCPRCLLLMGYDAEAARLLHNFIDATISVGSYGLIAGDPWPTVDHHKALSLFCEWQEAQNARAE